MKNMATKTKPRFPQLTNYLHQGVYYLVIGIFLMFFLYQLGE